MVKIQPALVAPYSSEICKQAFANIQAQSKTKTGQHNFPVAGDGWSLLIAETAGQTPALIGLEYGFSPPGTLDGIDFRDQLTQKAIEWHQRGALISLTWHAVQPKDDEPVEFEGGIQKNALSSAEWEELLTDNSPLNLRWQAQVDVIVGYLKQLERAGVPVIWRPYHEMNGKWFWWGGEPTRFVSLWKMIYQRMAVHHKLSNLIWFWNPNASYDSTVRFEPFFPGLEYVDMVGIDTYHNHYEIRHYEQCLALAGGKPIAIGECGHLPSPEILAKQPEWKYFMAWPDVVTKTNSPEFIREVYNCAFVENL